MKGEFLITILLVGLASAIPRFNYAIRAEQSDERNVCANKIGGIVADPEYCYKFIICVLYVEMSSVNCNPGEIYYGNTCRPGNPATCVLGPPVVTEKPEPTVEPETEPPVTSAPPPLGTDLNEICADVFFGARSYLDCGLFVGCIRGSGTIFQCGEFEIFDPTQLICIEGDRHACTSTPTPTPTPSTRWPTTTAQPLEEVCRGIPAGSVAHPSNCGLWIVCIQESYSIRQCPLGEIWLLSEGICKPGNSQTCELFPDLTQPSTVSEPTEATTVTTTVVTEVTTPTTVEIPETFTPTTIEVTTPTTVTETTTAVPQPCDGIQRGNVPHPSGNCAWYIQCSFERGTVRQCSANHIFNADLAECIPGNQSTCTPTN